MPGDVVGGGSQQRSEVGSGDPGQERERLVAAISRAAGEQGYDKLTVEHVVLHAGVSSATFYEHFATREQGLMAAFDAFLDRLWLEVHAVCETDAEWPQKVRAALAGRPRDRNDLIGLEEIHGELPNEAIPGVED